jgi:uncharacterized protein YdbL (DUF1318 family)
MRRTGITIGAAALSLWFASIGLAISLEEAKAKGLVGEKVNGYLGVVTASGPDVQTLTKDVNEKRREAYEDIAKRNRTPLASVEALAGEKAIQNTKPGNFVEGPGGWVRK